MSALRELEEQVWAKGGLVLGLDEAGRGPLAGPLVVCGVILPPDFICEDLDDSKRLTAKKRELLYQLLQKEALSIDLMIVDVATIDRLNIYRATQEAMQGLVDRTEADVVVSDAMPLVTEKPFYCWTKADHRSISVAAASVCAKVVRDKLMMELDKLYPHYGFENHKGYPTKAHYQAIADYGVLDCHRKSFKLHR